MAFAEGEQRVLDIFKLNELKSYQVEAIKALLDRQDVFVCQPTGSGKSLVFQALPLFYCEKKVFSLVISPLVSLMSDQVKFLNSIGVKSTCLRNGDDLDLQVGCGLPTSFFNTQLVRVFNAELLNLKSLFLKSI